MLVPFVLKIKTKTEMKLIISLFATFILASCTTIEYPDGTKVRTLDRAVVNDLIIPIIVDEYGK